MPADLYKTVQSVNWGLIADITAVDYFLWVTMGNKMHCKQSVIVNEPVKNKITESYATLPVE